MRKVCFNFKEDEDYDFFVELLLEVGINRIRAYKKLEAEKQELQSQYQSLTSKDIHIESVKSVADAKQVMHDEGYVFYKYKKPTALQKRRHRRTKKELEEAKILAVDRQVRTK